MIEQITIKHWFLTSLLALVGYAFFYDLGCFKEHFLGIVLSCNFVIAFGGLFESYLNRNLDRK